MTEDTKQIHFLEEIQMIAKRRWPWIAAQNWQHILFIHTPVPHETLRPVVPHPFDIDTHQGKGWMSIVLFQASQSRLRYMPGWVSYPRFFQMNLRTYVRFGNERGVYFFGIHTNDRTVTAGGNVFSLPFSKADIQLQKPNGVIHFNAEGLFGDPKSRFNVHYQPDSAVFTPSTDSLPHFLSERYCIWLLQGDTIVKAPIFHKHWQLQHANISASGRGHFPFPVTDETVSYYARFKHTLLHPFEKVGKVSDG